MVWRWTQPDWWARWPQSVVRFPTCLINKGLRPPVLLLHSSQSFILESSSLSFTLLSRFYSLWAKLLPYSVPIVNSFWPDNGCPQILSSHDLESSMDHMIMRYLVSCILGRVLFKVEAARLRLLVKYAFRDLTWHFMFGCITLEYKWWVLNIEMSFSSTVIT